MLTRKRIFIAVLCLAVAVAVGRPWLHDPAPELGPSIGGVPASPTSQTNPSLVVTAPSAVGYKFSINGGPHTAERPLSSPIDLSADVRIGDFTARAGSRELSDFLNLRSTDDSFTTFVDGVHITNAASPLQITYLVNRKRADVLAENFVNVSGAGVASLDVDLIEKLPAGPRFELTGLAVDGGELTRLPAVGPARRFKLSLRSDQATIQLAPAVNNAATTILLNGAPLGDEPVTLPAPAPGTVVEIQTIGTGGLSALYSIEVARNDSLAAGPRRGYYLRAFTPASAYFRIRNTGSGAASYRLDVNEKFGKTTQALVQEIADLPSEFPGEPLHRKAWRFVKANRMHWSPLTGARWNHSPSLLLNSVGFGFCDDSASLYAFLTRALGYDTRVWGLSGHVVPEVLVDGRWELWDPDLEVYYLTRGGAVAGVQELAADPDLIANPVERLPGAAGAYTELVRSIYASTADNNVEPWYTDPASILDPAMIFTMPAGSTLDFPDVYDSPLYAVDHQPVATYANARLLLPEGFSGEVALPLVIQSVGWTNRPSVAVLTVDSAGQWSTTPVFAEWSVDSYSPFTAATVDAQGAAPGPTVTLTRNEPGQTFYSVDPAAEPAAFAPYVGPVQSGHPVRYFSVDAVGNRERIRATGAAIQSVLLNMTGRTATTIDLAASATGGSGFYEYQFLLQEPGGWSAVRRYGDESSWTWDHTGVPPGSHSVLVCARNIGTGASTQLCKTIGVQVLPPPSPPALANPGDQVHITSRLSYADVVLRGSPAGYWRLAGMNGATALAEAGPAATLSGQVMPMVAGALADGNGALQFGAPHGYLRVPNPTVSLAGDLTIELWANISLATRQTLISKGWQREFELTVEKSGNLNLYFGNGTESQNVMTATPVIQPGVWHHLAIVRDAAAQAVRFYVDGVLRSTRPYTLAPAATTAVINVGSNGGGQLTTGGLDEVALYPRALSADEIRLHYVMRRADGSGTPVELQLTASDANGDPLSFSAQGLPSTLSLDAGTGLIVGTLTNAQAGTHRVTLTASDGTHETTQAFTWTITTEPHPPVLVNPGPQTTPNKWNYGNAVLTHSPFAYWRLGDVGGTSVADRSGTSHGNRFGGITDSVDGAIAEEDTAMSFDGATGYLRAPHPATSLAGNLTAELWVRTASLATRQTLISKGYLREFELTVERSGALNFYHGTGTEYEGMLSAGGVIGANTWHHVVVTRDTVARTIAFYVDGVGRGVRPYSMTPSAGPGPIFIGRSVDGSRFVNGRLDEVALFTSVLSAPQVLSHFAARNILNEPTQVALQLVASDEDGDALFFSASGLPPGLSIDSSTGLISGTLSTSGTYSVTATVSDATASDSESFTWTVTPPNRPPTLADPADITVNENGDVSIQLAGSDPDGQALTYAAANLPAGLAVDPATGVITGKPSFTSAGTYSVLATVSDGALAASQAFLITVQNVNQPPTLADPGEQVSLVGVAYVKSVAFDHPEAYWRLGDTVGTNVFATIGGPSGTRFGGVTGGQSGALPDGNTAMSFDGVSGHIRVPNPAAALNGDLTLELWVNVPLTTRQTVISKGYLNEFELTVEKSGRLNFYQGNGSSYLGLQSSVSIAANTWQHVVVTRVAATQTIAFYINGLPAGGGVLAVAPAASTSQIVIGRSTDGSRFVNGRLDEVAIYTAALSPLQVATHFATRTTVGSTSPLTLQLAASDGDGQPLTFTASGLPPGLSVGSTTGLVSGSVGVEAEGTYTVTVTASDGIATVSRTFTWQIRKR